MNSLTNWPARFTEMINLVGLSEEELQLIKASGHIVISNARFLNDFVYDKLLQFPHARKFFVTANDEPDEKRIEANKQTMISWLRATITAPSNEGFVRYLVGISQMHHNTPLHRPGLPPIPPRFIIGTLSFYQTAVAELLQKHMPDTALAVRTSVAWNKWFMVQLDLLLASYLAHDQDD